MPEPIAAQAAAPVATPGTELTVTQSVVPSGPPVADADRAAIIQRYETMYGQQQPAAAAPEPTAPAAAPVAATPAAPDLSAVVQALVAEINDMKGRMAQPAAPVATTPAEDQDWLKFLAEGNREKGEALLARKVQSLVGDQVQQQAVEKTLALIEAQNFANQIRTDNPDLMPMEQYITAASAQRIEAAQRAGKIKTPADYVTVYKDAIKTEVAALRNIILTYRGEGRQEGATRTTAVLASPSLAPSAVNTERGTQQQAVEPPAQTASDYLQERQLRAARQRGIA